MSEQITLLGADTFLGSYVLYLLSRQGYICKVPLLYPQRHRHLQFNDKIHLFETNVLQPNELTNVLKGSSIVLNFQRAYETKKYKLQHLEAYNHFYCKNLVQLSVKHKVKHLIHNSSLGLNQLVFQNPYWLSRSYGEKAIKATTQIKVSVVRSGWIYGEGISLDEEQCFIKKLAIELKNKKFYPLVGKNVLLSPVHIQDIADFYISLIQQSHNKKHQQIEVAGKINLSLTDITEIIHKATNSSTILYNCPSFLSSMVVKRNKTLNSFFPIGTKNFNLSLIPSKKTDYNNVHNTGSNVIEYIEALTQSTSPDDKFSALRKSSKR